MDLSSSKPHVQTTKYHPISNTTRDSIDNLYPDLESSSSTSTSSSTTLLSPPLKPDRMRNTNRYENSRSRTRIPTSVTWIRWGVVVSLQGVIIMLLFRLRPGTGKVDSGDIGGGGVGGKGEWKSTETETGGDVSGLYRPTTHKYTLLTPESEKFVPNMSSNENRMQVRKNWDMLMPLGSGTVEIPDYEQHPMLGKPIIDDPIHSGAIFEASWTHALHCLYYTVDSYHQLVVNGTFGFDGIRNDFHAAHCFEYLRNQILCMADMTLEGSESLLDATGEGQAHMCRDREEANAWIEERRVDDIQSIVGP
ncbi:Oxidase [Lachnellula willkommii]|uniref:Oxidase n=1 Tax=Lachnellula willkommii TaxID=215461 RepID=A0A559M2S7_9HELO|nr:Oxidase [Lachnellula willkommii]